MKKMDKNTTEMIIKKSNAGRKPVDDKKIQLYFFAKQSTINKFGGVEKIKDFVNQKIQEEALKLSSDGK